MATDVRSFNHKMQTIPYQGNLIQFWNKYTKCILQLTKKNTILHINMMHTDVLRVDVKKIPKNKQC